MRPELQGVVDEAARRLGAPITLEDRAFNLVAYGSQRRDVDFVRQGSILQRGSDPDVRTWFESFGIAHATGPVITAADPARGIAARLCLPARWRGVVYGYVWAYDWTGDPAGADADAVAAGMELAEHAGSLLAAQTRQRESAAETLTGLLSPDASEVGRAVAVVRDQLEVRADTPVVVVVAGTADSDEELSLNLWRLPRAVLAAATEVGTTMLVPLPVPARRPASSSAPIDLAPARSVAARVLELYAERLAGADDRVLVAGIGAPTTDLRAVRRSWRQARISRRVAGIDPSRRPVAVWDSLGPYRLLAADPPVDLLVDAPIQALLADTDLVHTVRTFLDHAGNVATTAAELGIHRQTLYHRLGRLETLTGLSMKRGEDRLRVHLALTLLPLL